MDEHEYPKPVRFFCVNCKREVIGLQDENGKMRVSCSYCGAVTVSQLKERRHIQFDVYAPKGQYLIQQ